MGAAEIALGQTPEQGIEVKVKPDFRLILRRRQDEFGFHSYILENPLKREKLVIPRFLLDRLRGVVRRLKKHLKDDEVPDEKIDFKGKVKIIVGRHKQKPDLFIIKGVDLAEGFLTIPVKAWSALEDLLFHDYLKHPNDVLSRIIAYHRLFQFTFSDSSESLNADLPLRADVLCHVEDYSPQLAQKVANPAGKLTYKVKPASIRKLLGDSAGDLPNMKFKPRLGEKAEGEIYGIDYSRLFSKEAQAPRNPPRAVPSSDKGESAVSRHAFAVPLLASEVKAFANTPFRCDFTTTEIASLRDGFLSSSESDFFLGFEIIDAVFRNSSGTLKTFRFPLYYVKVSLRQAGRQLLLVPAEGSRVYLNHVALANLVATFTPQSNPESALEHFFQTLLAQTVQVGGRLGRIYLSRLLPFRDELYDMTREILLGLPGESGKGGLLSELKLAGLECDLEAVYLYRASRRVSPLAEALDHDLDRIQEIAQETPARFYRSLLGRFLAPDMQPGLGKAHLFCRRPLMPGALPRSTRRLVEKLNSHDLVLLEGPPGTGKTHTIMNLFIHSVASGQRVLVVSDQKAAIDALREKILGYLLSSEKQEAAKRQLEELWKTSVKIIDHLPPHSAKLSQWSVELTQMLGLEGNKDVGWRQEGDELEKRIEELDRKIETHKTHLQTQLTARLGPQSSYRQRVAPKRQHATTVDDMESLTAFLHLITTSSGRDEYVKTIGRFIAARERLHLLKDHALYDTLQLPNEVTAGHGRFVDGAVALTQHLKRHKPRSLLTLRKKLGPFKKSGLGNFLSGFWQKAFPPDASKVKIIIKVLLSYIKHPATGSLKLLEDVFKSQQRLFRLQSKIPPGVWRQLQLIHQSLHPKEKGEVPLALEICRFALMQTRGKAMESCQTLLEKIAVLQDERDGLVRRIFLSRMGEVARRAMKPADGAQHRSAAALAAMVSHLAHFDNLTSASGNLKDLQEELVKLFPFWICRKQAVPFLFPCVERTFDLVIVDEATQCKVDDALPLLFRAKKIMVVGDDKQTVLETNSVIDDYLFAEFNLEEHLRGTQARAIKGGGSNIFGLVKSIREASVMLDEHYRCPPDIISFSNKYVYDGELKTMQWVPKGRVPAVEIDFSEAKAPPPERLDSGQYKGLETAMIDRFFDYITRTIKRLEVETGERINMESDVALCYFLLKNEPYVKARKSEFLRRLGRGDDVLDGAGAALQGKERHYIFYFWDISRANIMAFKQGDDPTKRRGELNVLMSRPKNKAYHFLHHDFAQVDHHKSSIADYLWRTYQAQQERGPDRVWQMRTKKPSEDFYPWRRSSGPLIEKFLQFVARDVSQGLVSERTQYGVVVGDPSQRVDLMILPPEWGKNRHATALMDLAGFEFHQGIADDVIDYFFQLQRAAPGIKPVFAFMHEFCTPDHEVLEAVRKLLKS